MTATDDADRANYVGSYAETFDADPDSWFDDNAGPRCADADGHPCCLDRDGRYVGPGCRHCCPPDAEAIDTGFERWDRPGFYRVTREQQILATIGYALDPNFSAGGAKVRDAMIDHNPRLQSAARRKLAAICDDCETHDAAVATYAAWAAMVRLKLAGPGPSASQPAP